MNDKWYIEKYLQGEWIGTTPYGMSRQQAAKLAIAASHMPQNREVEFRVVHDSQLHLSASSLSLH